MLRAGGFTLSGICQSAAIGEIDKGEFKEGARVNKVKGDFNKAATWGEVQVAITTMIPNRNKFTTQAV